MVKERTTEHILVVSGIDLILNVLSGVIAQFITPSRNAKPATTCQPQRHATPSHVVKLNEGQQTIMMPRTQLVVVVALLGVMVVMGGVEGRDAEYYLKRWSAKNKDMNKVITPEDPSGQIPSPLLNPWSRLPPGATARAVMALTGNSNDTTTTTQIPADAQLLPPSLSDPPATLPAFPDATERDAKREWVRMGG